MSDDPSVLVVDDALRPVAPPRARGRLALALLAALAIEAGVVAVAMWERTATPAPEVVEIPVEIVPEPSPQPSPPPPAPPRTQEAMKPAVDAPRAGKSDHDDEHVAEKEKPAAAPPPPAPKPSTDPSPPAEAAAPDLPKAADPDAPEPLKAETPKPTAPKPAAPKPSVLAALPKSYADVPDVDFGGAAIRSPVTGGSAKSTYLTQLYGLIVPRLRVPPVAKAYGRTLTGAIGFSVDGRGRLMQRVVVEGSGSMELDEAAMEAVAAASKAFPPPPKGEPIGMKFTYSVN